MTGLLAIVRTSDEAGTALALGADRVAILPAFGAAAEHPREPRWGRMIWPSNEDPTPAAGLLDGDERGPLWLPAQAGWVAVLRAALASGRAVTGCIEVDAVEAGLAAASAAGLSEVLIGTAPFSGRHLLEVAGPETLAGVAQQCRAAGLRFGFVGSLEPPDVPRLQALEADEIGFDTALRGPANVFDGARTSRLLALVRTEPKPEATSARAGAGGVTRSSFAAAMPTHPDRIFVRDWTVAMSVGVYERERGQPQRVRFTVEAGIESGQGDGLAATVSYDLITDAIARIAADHVELVEEIANRLASAVLAHPRVIDLDITVEKLDVGPGSVGCRIHRRRPSA